MVLGNEHPGNTGVPRALTPKYYLTVYSYAGHSVEVKQQIVDMAMNASGIRDTQSRLRKGHLPVLFSDGYEGYEPSILEAFGRRYTAPKSGLAGRPRLDLMRWPQGLAYAQVIKSAKEQISDGIHLRVIRGKAQLLRTLSLLGYDKINTSSVERQNGTSRLHNQRKVRRTLAFSKSHLYHGWMSWLSVVQYNFCRAHGSLRIKDERGFHHRTPAMASGLTQRIWSTRDWLLSPIRGG